jgi:hypothetical protein
MVAVVWAAVDPVVERVRRRIDLIESGKAKPGAAFVFTSAELNAWGRAKAKELVPEGLREPRVELGNGTATGYGLVDFLKLRHAAGVESSWLVAKLIQGEKRVRVAARIQSRKGTVTVHLTRVELSGLAVSGAPLDFLIETFFLPLYPNARLDEPVELSEGVDRIVVTPGAARVYMK